MKITLFLLALLFFSLTSIQAESIFNHEKKDAASALILKVEKDRKIEEVENRRYLAPSQDYSTQKFFQMEERISGLENRIAELEKKLDDLQRYPK